MSFGKRKHEMITVVNMHGSNDLSRFALSANKTLQRVPERIYQVGVPASTGFSSVKNGTPTHLFRLENALWANQHLMRGLIFHDPFRLG